MHLTLSSDSIWKASFTEDSGHVLYKFDSPLMTGTHEYITLYKHKTGGGGSGDEMEVVGKLVYHRLSAEKSRVVSNDDLSENNEPGAEIGEILRESGSAGITYGSFPSHAFRASDGKEYEWVFGYRECLLYPKSLSPGPPTATSSQSDKGGAIIRFNHQMFNLLSPSRPTSIDITDGHEGVVDLALLTLAYLEKVRRHDKGKVKRAQGLAAAMLAL
ncbi:hypothetical protein CVT24_002823 [Panaeolus cyanescens]|uniref:DUF6593 domain-containing protein n=1 Tax=Panaeolus cyanescens TaxID=181874 RepID=A0A409YRI1_9AGAR|nr:hypothetical protein CVT24_002823 [Panaeolus cyanescens]